MFTFDFYLFGFLFTKAKMYPTDTAFFASKSCLGYLIGLVFLHIASMSQSEQDGVTCLHTRWYVFKGKVHEHTVGKVLIESFFLTEFFKKKSK